MKEDDITQWPSSMDDAFPPTFQILKKQIQDMYIQEMERNFKRKTSGIPLSSFPSLYKKYYHRELTLKFYGCKRMKDLFERKLADIFSVHVEPQNPTVTLVTLKVSTKNDSGSKRLEVLKEYNDKIIEILEIGDARISAQILDSRLRQIFEGFNIKSLGFKRFKEFLEALKEEFNDFSFEESGHVLYIHKQTESFQLSEQSSPGPQFRNQVEQMAEGILKDQEIKQSQVKDEYLAEVERQVPNFNQQLPPTQFNGFYSMILNPEAPSFSSREHNEFPSLSQKQTKQLYDLIAVLRCRINGLEQELHNERVENKNLKSYAQMLEGKLRVEELKNKRTVYQEEEEQSEYNPLYRSSIWSSSSKRDDSNSKKSFLGQAVNFQKK